MKKINVVFAIALTLALVLPFFAGCGKTAQTGDNTSAVTDSVTTAPEVSTEAPDMTPVRVAVLSGTTGFGIAPLYRDLSENKIDDISLTIDFYSDATLVSPLIISGQADIAAVPTNLAAVLYNKTAGKVKVLAVNTLGVLYLLEQGNTVNSLADLDGKTVYLPGQGTNPEYVFRALVRASGISGLEDRINFDYTYPTPDELTTAVATGKASLAVLPEPKVTAAMMKNENIRIALNFSDEWKNATGAELVQGCLIVRSEFAEAHPDVVARFAAHYAESVEKVVSSPDSAAADVVFAGIAPNEALVKNALPKCNIVYLTGDAMKTALNGFWKSLFDIIPSSVGGALPDDGIF